MHTFKLLLMPYYHAVIDIGFSWFVNRVTLQNIGMWMYAISKMHYHHPYCYLLINL